MCAWLTQWKLTDQFRTFSRRKAIQNYRQRSINWLANILSIFRNTSTYITQISTVFSVYMWIGMVQNENGKSTVQQFYSVYFVICYSHQKIKTKLVYFLNIYKRRRKKNVKRSLTGNIYSKLNRIFLWKGICNWYRNV